MHEFDLRRYTVHIFVGKFLLKFHVVKSVSKGGDLNYGSQKRVTFVCVTYGEKIRAKYIQK
jgi:hypothetical protein